MIPTIELIESGGRAVLGLRCVEPVSKFFSPGHPTDLERLEWALSACPGAEARVVGHEFSPVPGDFGDEVFVVELDLTPANVLALQASPFTWAPTAESAADGFLIGPEELEAARERVARALEGHRRGLLAPGHIEPRPIRWQLPPAPGPAGSGDRRGGRVRAVAGFLGNCLEGAIGYGLAVGLLFVPFGALVGLLTRDPWAIPMIALCGGVLGGMLGVGEVIIDRFSQRPKVDSGGAGLGRTLLGIYAGPLLPSWLGLLEAGHELITRDHSQARPGRWKRGLIGGATLMVLMGLVVGAAVLTSPIDPAPGWGSAVVVLIAVAGLIGGVAGALTDSV